MAVIRNLCTPCDDAAFYNQITIAGDAPVISESAAPSGGDHPTLAPQVVVQEYDDIHRLFVSNDAAAWSHIDISYNAAQSVANIAALPDANVGTHESYHVRSNRMVYNRTRSSYYTAEFPGPPNKINLNKTLISPQDDFDVTIEVRSDAPSAGGQLFFGQRASSANDGRMQVAATATGFQAYVEGTPTDIILNGTTAIVSGVWYEIRFKRTGDRFDLYVNGSIEATQIEQGILVYNGVETYLGISDTSLDNFNGAIRNVSITSNGTTTKYLTETIDLPGATPSGGAASSLEPVEKFVPTKISYCDTDTEWSNMTEMVDGQILYHRGRSAAYIYSETSGSWSLYGTPLSSSKKVPEVSVERTALYLDNRAGENYVANYDNKAWLVDQSRSGTPRRMRPKYTLNLNGSSDYAEIDGASPVPLLGNTYTFTGWLNLTANGDAIMAAGGAVGGGWLIAYYNTYFEFTGKTIGGGDAFKLRSETFDAISGWHHWAIVLTMSADGNDASASHYLDGVALADDIITTAGGYTDGTAPFVLGARDEGGSLHAQGRLDDIRVYSGALTDSQIADLAALKPGSIRGASIGETPLIWYDFEGPTDSHLLLNKGSLGPDADAVINVNNARDAVGYYSFANEVGFSETTPRLDFNGPTAWHGSYASSYEFEGPFRVDLIWRNISHGEDHIGFTDLDVNSAFQTSTYNHARQIGIRITPSTCFAYINAGSAAGSTGVASGDVISIERDDNDVVHFRKNGVDFYTSSPQTGTFRYVYANYGNRTSYQTSVSENGIRLTNDQLDIFAFGNQKELLAGAVENSTAVIPADPTRPFTHDAEGLGGLQYVGQCPHGATVSSQVPDFDGTGDHFNFGTLDLEITDEITCSCWIKTTEVGTEGLFGSWLGSGDFRSFLMFLQNGDFGCSISSDGTYTVTTVMQVAAEEGTAVVNDGVWHHILATVKTNDGLPKLYIDSKLAVSTESASTASELGAFQSTAIADFEIGRYNQDNNTCVDAELADVRVYNRVLTQDEITSLSNGIDIRDDSLKIHVPLTENAGDLAFSTVGGYVGTGSPISRSGSIDTYDTLVSDGYSIGTWFDGANDYYLSSGTSVTTEGGPTKMTVAARFNCAGFGAARMIVTEYNATGNKRAYQLYVNTSGKIQLIISPDGASAPNLINFESTNTINVDTWYDAVFTFDAGEYHLFVNGTEWTGVDAGGGTIGNIYDSGTELGIGGRSDPNPAEFSGIISQVIIHKGVAWTDEQRAAIRAVGKTSEVGAIVGSLGGTAWYFPYGNGQETLQSLTPLTEVGAPEQRIIPYGASTSNGIVIPRTHGPGVLAPGQSIDLYNDETDSPYATRLDATLTNGTYAQGDNKEDSILYVRTDETGDDRISVFDEALSGNDDSAIREDTR